MMRPYSSIDTAPVWKNSYFIKDIRSPYGRGNAINKLINSISSFTNVYVYIDFCRWNIATEVYEMVY